MHLEGESPVRCYIILYDFSVLHNTILGGFIGNLPNEQHGISGKFYVVDSKTIFIEDFNYDGGGPGIKRLCQMIYNLKLLIS